MKQIKLNIKNICQSIRHNAHDYYWWKHRKSDEEIKKINNTQVIALDDLAVILAKEFKAVNSELNEEDIIKTITTNYSHL